MLSIPLLAYLAGRHFFRGRVGLLAEYHLAMALPAALFAACADSPAEAGATVHQRLLQPLARC
jgi:hypothetical protein